MFTINMSLTSDITAIARFPVVFTSLRTYLPEDCAQQSQEQKTSNYGHHNPPQWDILLAIRAPPNYTGICLTQIKGVFLHSFYRNLYLMLIKSVCLNYTNKITCLPLLVHQAKSLAGSQTACLLPHSEPWTRGHSSHKASKN